MWYLEVFHTTRYHIKAFQEPIPAIPVTQWGGKEGGLRFSLVIKGSLN